MSEKDKSVIALEQLQHEHPLEHVDLLPNYPRYEEYEDIDDDDEDDDDEDDDDDDVTKWDFGSRCNLCGKQVNLYQRYYYKCSHNSCDYVLHRWCRELPTTISLRSHRCLGTLTLCNILYEWRCEICKSRLGPNENVFRCPINRCYFHVHVKCVIPSIENQIIYHPSHPHPLNRATTHEPNSYYCDACGEKHMGNLYHCTTCVDFSVQSDCLVLPKKKLTTHHTHPLILSYRFPWEHQKAEFYPTCRICSGSFHDETLWIYKCDKCRYYVHLDCENSKGDDFISETGKDYAEREYPNIVNLPFRDQTESIQKHLFLKEITSSTPPNVELDDNLLQLTHHNCHQHPLRLIFHSDTSSISCHNPWKKIELLCDGCVRPITGMPFFQCTHHHHQGCSFVLHEWCTRLPPELQNHPAHPQHTLTLLPKVPGFGVFKCRVCKLPCNGFAYGCERCEEYYIDVTCAFMPEAITHEAHPNHLFLRVQDHGYCLACLQYVSGSFSYKCRTCEDVILHPKCGLLIPKRIMHKYDKHPMKLSYKPIENHKSEYFCEICEEKLNPNKWFYHCDELGCAQSVHSACAPLILQSERDTYSMFEMGVYLYVNIKFGRVVENIGGRHSHSVLFAQGIHDDGQCVKCERSVRYKMIFKCLPCKFVIHYDCVFDQ